MAAFVRSLDNSSLVIFSMIGEISGWVPSIYTPFFSRRMIPRSSVVFFISDIAFLTSSSDTFKILEIAEMLIGSALKNSIASILDFNCILYKPYKLYELYKLVARSPRPIMLHLYIMKIMVLSDGNHSPLHKFKHGEEAYNHIHLFIFTS